MKHFLLLGSKSAGRQTLLREAKIPFVLVSQDANEQECDWNLPIAQTTKNIARHKMDHVMLPIGKEGQICFVLTADTLTADKQGKLYGKPADEQETRQVFVVLRNGVQVGTAFCLERKRWVGDAWKTDERIEQFVGSECIVDIPDQMFTAYIAQFPNYLEYSAGMEIQGFGAQFVKSIVGSYTAIIGLPMFELCRALRDIKFFEED